MNLRHHRFVAGACMLNTQSTTQSPMTDTTILPLTEADVKALGFTRFGREREDDMGGSLAHRDGEAFYMQRAAAFWSIDPEYGNMRNALCEAPPNWRAWRNGCMPTFGLWNAAGDIYVWRASTLPADRLALMFNNDQIAPVLAGLKAQAEAEAPQNAIGVPGGHWDIISGSAPTKRRPLVVGDRVMSVYRDSHAIQVVTDVLAMLSPDGYPAVAVALDDGTVARDDGLYLILPREGE